MAHAPVEDGLRVSHKMAHASVAGRLLPGPPGFRGTVGDRYIAPGTDCTLIYVEAYRPLQEHLVDDGCRPLSRHPAAINRTDTVAVLINWLHRESIREHLLRRENRAYANKLMQIADFHRTIQFTLNKPCGYVKKTKVVLKSLKISLRLESDAKSLSIKKGSPLPFELRTDYLSKSSFVKTITNPTRCGDIAIGDRLVCMTTSEGVTNLFALKPKYCRVRLNEAGGRSHIMLHFNRLPPYHPEFGAVQHHKAEAMDDCNTTITHEAVPALTQ